jgi:hypothetical protein
MSSGPTRIVYNTRERLISTDPNRGQAFAAQAQQEAWRAQFNDLQANWKLFPGVSSQVQVVGSPVYGEVYSGLMVRPDVASYLLIDPGVAMVIATNIPSSDDSPYVYVRDPGVQTPGVLTFTANVTPATLRWDVVECQPVDTLLESSSRDIYNPATGLFVPAIIDKVRAARMTYRIRLGTPGAGFPGAVEGWMPLAVAAVRDGATGFQQCDFYDVRPLVSDRVRPQPIGAVGNENQSQIEEAHYQCAGGSFSGHSESEFGGYLAGGALRTSVPATSLAEFGATGDQGGDYKAFAMANAGNIGTYAVPTSGSYYIAALFPKPAVGQVFIPRWARYSELPVAALGRRVPNGPRGILVATTAVPGPNNQFAPMSFPAAAQLGVEGIGVAIATGSTFGTVFGNAVQVGRTFEHASNVLLAGVWSKPATGLSPDLAYWSLVAGVDFPTGARGVRVSIHVVVSNATGIGYFYVRSCFSSGNSASVLKATIDKLTTGPLVTQAGEIGTIAVMRPPQSNDGLSYPLTPDIDWTIRLVPATPGTTFTSASIDIHGWIY